MITVLPYRSVAPTPHGRVFPTRQDFHPSAAAGRFLLMRLFVNCRKTVEIPKGPWFS